MEKARQQNKEVKGWEKIFHVNSNINRIGAWLYYCQKNRLQVKNCLQETKKGIIY